MLLGSLSVTSRSGWFVRVRRLVVIGVVLLTGPLFPVGVGSLVVRGVFGIYALLG
jgi:hypothetical protein